MKIMKYQLITLFVLVSVCHGQTTNATIPTVSVKDSINVNNHTVTIPPVTEIVPSTDNTTVAPNVTTPSPTTTTPTPTPTTTVKPTTKPNPPPITTTKVTTVPPPTPTNATTAKPTNSPTTKEPPTKPPSSTVVPPTPASNRKFDGPSFVGGIVLASGLMAIGFVAFKFYRARTELNYHTL